MIRTNLAFLPLLICFFAISTTTSAQTGNFDETWIEFLENNKISNMSTLIKPNKQYERPKYAQYLLMNTNSSFCQSDVEDAETLLEEVQAMDPLVHKSIPGFGGKLTDLQKKIEAYHTMDAIWLDFLQTQTVDLDQLEAVEAVKTSCEKKTLAKYSYMTAYYHFCEGDVAKSKDIFENRTLRLTEKTSLRIRDVEGLEGQVSKMKTLYQNMTVLDAAWKNYVASGVSSGFDIELPLFPCNPIPNMKEFVLKGAADLCTEGPLMLEKIKQLQTESGVTPDRELANQIKNLEAAIGRNDSRLAALNSAWEAFVPNNQVTQVGKYGYEYCSREPLIRAYIMDGFAYTCELAEEMLEKIDSLQLAEMTPLEDITMEKINQLSILNQRFQSNAVDMEMIWKSFVANGDRLTSDYISADYYCDNIHQVKDWAIRGLSSDCEGGLQYLERIEEFQRMFEFNLFEELECRVQDLRVKVWECRHQALEKLARIEAPEAVEDRLVELMEEYGMTERPEECTYR